MAVRQVVRDLAGQVLSERTVDHTYRFGGGRILAMDIGEPAQNVDS